MTRVPVRLLACTGSIGFSLAVFSACTIHRFEELLHPGASLEPLVLSAMLLCLALGLGIPNYLARHFFGSHSRNLAQQLIADRVTVDHAAIVSAMQMQTLCSAGLVLSGLSMMAAPLLVPVGKLYHAALQSFHWTWLTGQLLELAVALGYVLLPCAFLGIALNCAQRRILLYTPNVALSSGLVMAGLSCGSVAWGLMAGLQSSAVELMGALLLLFNGVATLGRKGMELSAMGREPQMPDFADRWRFILIWVLYAMCFLTALYLVSWQRLSEVTSLVPDGPGALGSLGFGLLLSASTRGWSGKSMRGIAVLCMLASVSVAVTCGIGVPTGCSLGSKGTLVGEPATWCVRLAAMLMGVIAGLVLAAVVERSPQSKSSLIRCSVAACVSSAVAYLGCWSLTGHEARVFHTFVIIALAWLLLGGIVLIYEPGFRIPRRLPQTASMLGVLALLILVLPQLAPKWAGLSLRTAHASTGSLKVVNHWGGSEFLGERFAGSDDQSMSIDSLLRLMQFTKEKYDGIFITWPSASSEPSSESIRFAVARAARSRLRPDGVLLTRFAEENLSAVAAGTTRVP